MPSTSQRLSRTQTGFRLRAWGGPLVWEEFELREPRDGEVLVQMLACGIGRTVVHNLAGNLTTDPGLLPRVPGHELVGRVAAGAGAGRALLDQLVVGYFYLSCRVCPTCLSGDEPRCERLAGWIGTHVDGGYAPWAVLPASAVVPVPRSLDPVAATVVPDALASPVHVCGRRARIRPGDRVVVIGAGGGVGIHLVQVAQLMGAAVLGIDLTEAKCRLVESFGAQAAPGADLDGVVPAARLGGPPTVVVDLVGTDGTLAWARECLAPGGRLVVVTTAAGGGLALGSRDVVFKELSVLGSRYARRSEIGVAAELVRSGRIRPVIGATTDPAGVPEVHEQLLAGTLAGRGAVRWTVSS